MGSSLPDPAPPGETAGFDTQPCRYLF